MASSSTPEAMTTSLLRFAQDPVNVSCDQCELEEDVSSYCTECVKNMCIKCKQLHDHLHEDHTIITVFEGRIIKHLTTNCQTHILVFSCFCDDCQINICDECRKTAHSHCNIIDVDRHAEMLRNTFTERLDELRKQLPEIDKQSNSIKEHLTNFDKGIESQITLVESETEIMELRSKQEHVHKTLQEQIKTLQCLRISIDDITTSLKTQMNLVQSAGVLQLVNDGNTKLDSISIQQSFELGDPSTFPLSNLLGQGKDPLGLLQNDDNMILNIDTSIESCNTNTGTPSSTPPSPTPSVHDSVSLGQLPSLSEEITIFREFSKSHYVVSCTADGSTCWVSLLSDLYSGAVQLVDQDGNQLLRVELSHGLCYTALTTNGELLVSGYDTTVISRVNKLGEVSEFADISELNVENVIGLVTTQHDDVLVCVRMIFEMQDKVIKLNARGSKILELDPQLFSRSRLSGIHAVSRDTFCVVDGPSRYADELVFVNSGGELVKRINLKKTELSKNITAITGDRHGHLIIARRTHYAKGYIYILSDEGICERVFDVDTGYIKSMTVGDDDVLWMAVWPVEYKNQMFKSQRLWREDRVWTGELMVAKYLD